MPRKGALTLCVVGAFTLRSTFSFLHIVTPRSAAAQALAMAHTRTAHHRAGGRDLYRADGVRIGYDPYSPEMIEKYGAPGETDVEGFNPYADTVGPGIYGGRVKRDANGEVVIGEQYQGHNPRPGPVYAGGGYTAMVQALSQGEAAVNALLDKYPDLVNEVSTGGATPLHMCGMSRRNQAMTELIIKRGGNIEAVDTYGYRPLHRMASNNLAIGAEALLKAGAAPKAATQHGDTPWSVARHAHAVDVLMVLQRYLNKE